jgi:heme A synthase
VVSGEGLFRRLAVVTVLFAYLQIALGGVVRVTGSGLGCPDWPLCHGRPYPPANLNSIIEYSHRAVGSVTELLIAITAILAWVVWRHRRPLVAWLATASLVAGLGEALLGAGVVANLLASWLVLIHLAVAMLILGFLIATAVAAMPTSQGVFDPNFRRLAFIAAGATYLLLLTGSTVVASGADKSCNSWPICGNGFAFDFSGANAFTMLHRGSVLVIGLLLLHVLSTAVRRWRGVHGMRWMAGGAIVVFVLQVAVGAGSAINGGAFFDGLHVALATLVWAGVLGTALLTLPRADREHEVARLSVDTRSA